MVDEFCADQWECFPNFESIEGKEKAREKGREEKSFPVILKSEEDASETHSEFDLHIWEG